MLADPFSLEQAGFCGGIPVRAIDLVVCEVDVWWWQSSELIGRLGSVVSLHRLHQHQHFPDYIERCCLTDRIGISLNKTQANLMMIRAGTRDGL